jgi:hypothetical protein
VIQQALALTSPAPSTAQSVGNPTTTQTCEIFIAGGWLETLLGRTVTTEDTPIAPIEEPAPVTPATPPPDEPVLIDQEGNIINPVDPLEGTTPGTLETPSEPIPPEIKVGETWQPPRFSPPTRAERILEALRQALEAANSFGRH